MAGGKNSQSGFQPDSDVHITFEEQQKINKFARQNAKLEDYKEELKVKQNELKNLEDASDELALMDDDVKIPYYIGEVFVHQCLEKTLSCLEDAKDKKKNRNYEFGKQMYRFEDYHERFKNTIICKVW